MCNRDEFLHKKAVFRGLEWFEWYYSCPPLVLSFFSKLPHFISVTYGPCLLG
jgi:hypothetical protein